MYKNLLIAAAVALVAACSQMRPAPQPVNTSGHLDGGDVGTQAGIPAVVQHTPFIPPPQPVPESERYTVVVNDVPVRELLFALARDAEVNVDIHPSIEGSVTLNAIDQTLTQILDRIANQVDLRYVINGDTVLISADEPYFRTYNVGYVNLSSYNRFWETLNANILAIIGDPSGNRDNRESGNVVVNAEAGLINVRTTARNHELVQNFVDRVLRNARRQVMIEATIVEVTLNDQYQAGVDWRVLLDDDKSGFGANSDLLGSVTDGVIDSAISSFVFGYADPNNNGRAIDVTVRLLREFGDTKVLSSPRMMALNNQTAMLKVVEELIYFDIEVENRDGTDQSAGRTFVDTDVKSVPVGLVMAVTPQISDNSEITLTIRPSISEKIGDAIDPAPQLNNNLTAAGETISNLVPVIRVREMESVLRLNNGQIAVLGGLMQDSIQTADRSVPGLSKIPFLGEMFFDTQETSSKKTELVIFLRPVVINDPSLETDLKGYEQFLSNNVKNPVY